jgi:diguanylate cyclase (GGDEF)-like protein
VATVSDGRLAPEGENGATLRPADAVLAALRRLGRAGERPDGEEGVYATLAHELIAVLGAEEVHVHLLDPHGGSHGGCDRVVVYLFDGDARLSYVQQIGERPPGVSWSHASGRSFLAVGARELTASVPRLSTVTPPAPDAIPCALLVPLTLGSHVESVIVLVRRAVDPYGEWAIGQAEALVDQAATVIALTRARAEAGTDPVAGCLNHRGMRRRLGEEVARAQRYGGALACAIVDIDDFKQINDRYGHPAGDTILREVAQALEGEFRAFDRVARYGGDEFVVILPSADLDSAASAGERALQRVRAVQLPDLSGGVRASMGVAQWREPMSADGLLEACDAALLRGKRARKGGVTRAPSAAPVP